MKSFFICHSPALLLLGSLAAGCGPSVDDKAGSLIVIESNPPGALLSLDGVDLGATPVSLDLDSMNFNFESMSGSSQVDLDLDGYHSESIRIVLQPSKLVFSGNGLMFSSQRSLFGVGKWTLNTRLTPLSEDHPGTDNSIISTSWPFH